ncbi:MAG: GDSL-type esterase/lipase family protein [bacterium]|nr:GDSL-type esterase/lipase family protein [bacterium]
MMKWLKSIVATVLVLIGLELFLGLMNLIFPWDAMVQRACVRRQEFLTNKEFDLRGQYYRDSDLFWLLKPNWQIGGKIVNSKGFRGPEFDIQKPERTIRIICLGNSCTFGWVDRYKDTYPALLWSQLAQSYPSKKIEVINCGIEGYSTYQILKMWDKSISSLRPDFVTIYTGHNDLIYSPFKEDKEIKISRWQCNISNLLYTSRIITVSSAIKNQIIKLINRNKDFTSPYYSDRGILRRVSITDYEMNLSALTEKIIAAKAVPILVTSPIQPRYPFCPFPRPIVRVEDRKQIVHWLTAETVSRFWEDRLNQSGNYQSELDRALVKLKTDPSWPISYFKAAVCYSALGDSDNANKYFFLADSLDTLRRDFEAYNQIMRKITLKYQAPLVDLANIMNKGDTTILYSGDGYHPNEAGNIRIAEELFKVVYVLIKFDSTLTQ